MLVIFKAVLLLVLELIIEYLFGTLVVKLVLKRSIHPVANVLIGFAAYQGMFQIGALFFIFTTGVLHQLSAAWIVVVGITVILSVVLCRKIIMTHITDGIKCIRAHRGIFSCVLLVLFIFCYYVSINGEINEDARYYIGLITTSVDTDSLFRYNVYNGYEVDSLYLRRVLATFEIHSAVLSQIFQIHPLVVTRVFRACQNVILTSAAVYLCAEELLWKKEVQAVEKSLVTVVVFWFMQLIFADSIYTPAAFGLYRAYEAKAFTANVLVLFGLYLCIKVMREKGNRNILLVLIFLWGCMAMSTSAMIVGGAECVVLLAALWLHERLLKKKQERLHAI